MKLTSEEQAMLAGEQGPIRQWAISHQVAVGDFFDAEDFVPVSHAHIMADTESLGESVVNWLEALVGQPGARLAVPTITDPRGLDLATYRRLRQTEAMASLGIEAIAQYAKDGTKPKPTPGKSFFDTGVALVTDKPAEGVPSISVKEGLDKCWG